MDLVLQGNADNYTLEVADHYLQLEFVNNIIISCWENNNIESNNPRIIITKNVDLDNPGLKNRNRLIKSSLEGLKKVKTEFSAKIRGDNKVSLDSMYKIYNYYNINKTREIAYCDDESKPKNKIGVLGIYPKFPFHPCDELIWGNTLDLIELFSSCEYCSSSLSDEENYNNVMRSEVHIVIQYISKFEKKINKFIENKHLYLIDNAQNIREALQVSNEIITKIMIPFPKIEREWPKYPPQLYSYEYRNHLYNYYWGKDI